MVLSRTMKDVLSSVKKTTYDEFGNYVIILGTCYFYCLFFNAMQNHKEVVGLYGKSFVFLNDLIPILTRDKAHINAPGDIRDDAEQYAYEHISLDKDADFH